MSTAELTILTHNEQTELDFLEGRIDQALSLATAASITIATCLKQIHDKHLYRPHGTFDSYCRTRWQRGRQWGYQLIEAAQVLNTLTDDQNVRNCVQILPENEAQIRPLTRLNPEQQPSAWSRAVELADQDGSGITARHVQQAVDETKTPSNRVPFDLEDDEPLSAYEETIAAQYHQPAVIDFPDCASSCSTPSMAC